MKFRVGDRVRCVDAAFSFRGLLVHGRVYTVQGMRTFDAASYVVLRGVPSEWDPMRFQRVTATTGTVAPEHRSRVDAGPRWMG